jgi:trans-2,3-dihydro-3-hydroxyanthranilate isomerase
MKYKFYTCDVFTDVRFGGNPLAVLPNAEGLSSEQMQNIAREFNYSESTFVFPCNDEWTRNVRIFTPTQEIPFAGHPNIGTAFTLASIAEFGDFDNQINIVFEEIAGAVPITIRRINTEVWCELKAPEPLFIDQAVSIDLIASALSLTANDIAIDTHQPVEASVGLPFIVVELKDRTALENARSHMPTFDEMQSKGITTDILIYVRSDDEFDIRVRVFAPLDGVPEDPATGSANCALVALLTHCMSIDEGEFSWRIGQGFEMNRPSTLNARTRKQSGIVSGVWVAGRCKMVSEGYIEV